MGFKSFSANINLNFDTFNLDKLYEDSNKVGALNTFTNHSDVVTDYKVNNPARPNIGNNSGVETVNLSTDVDNNSAYNVNNIAASNRSDVSAMNSENDVLSKGFNNNLGLQSENNNFGSNVNVTNVGMNGKGFESLVGIKDNSETGAIAMAASAVASNALNINITNIKGAVTWGNEGIQKVNVFITDLLEKTGAFITKVGTAVESALKGVFSWTIDYLKMCLASTVNVIISLVKGVILLVESILDFALIVLAAGGTIITGVIDVIAGIVTGEWNWNATKDMWSGAKTIVSYQWTNALADSFYNTKVGQFLDENAQKLFKSDGMACTIIEGVGYVAGIVTLTILTFGAGGLAAAGGAGAGAATSTGVAGLQFAATATAAGIGKYTSEEWNKNVISINYRGEDLSFSIDYETYAEIVALKQGQSKLLTQQFIDNDGNPLEISFKVISKGNGQYEVIDDEGNMSILNSLNESSTAKGLGIGTIKGAWEGLQWYIGGKINGLFKATNSVITNKYVSSIIRVGLDSLTGALEVPFQSFMSMLSDKISWNEAWQLNGGWDSVKSQVILAGSMSFLGEISDIISPMITNKLKKTLNSLNESTIKDFMNNVSDSKLKKILSVADVDQTKLILKNMSDSQFEKLLTATDIDLTKLLSASSVDQTKLILKNISDSQLEKLLAGASVDQTKLILKNISDSQLEKLLAGASVDQTKLILKNISDFRLKKLIILNYIDLNDIDLTKLFFAADIEQAELILKNISIEKFENIIKNLVLADDYVKLYFSVSHLKQIKTLVNQLEQNQLLYSEVLTKLLTIPAFDPNLFLKLSDDKVILEVICQLPIESQFKLLNSITDEVELNKLVNNINSIIEWDKLIEDTLSGNLTSQAVEKLKNALKYINLDNLLNCLKSLDSSKFGLVIRLLSDENTCLLVNHFLATGQDQAIKDMLKYVSDLKTAYCLEKLELTDAAKMVRLLTPDQFVGVKEELEGVVAYKLATKYQISELYDEKVARFITFWQNDMIDNFKRRFDFCLPSDRIDRLSDVNVKCFNSYRFNILVADSRCAAFNGHDLTAFNFGYNEGILMSNCSHEFIHELSRNVYTDSFGKSYTLYGFSSGKYFRGINECATEYLNELAMGDNYYTKLTGELYCGYQYGVTRLRKLCDFGVLEHNKFIASYFSNDITYLETEITKLKGKDFFDKLILAFDDSISGDKQIRNKALAELDKMISTLVVTKGMGN